MKQFKITSFFSMFSLTIVIFFITSCKKINFETGITGKIEYGQGDCMPVIDESKRTYEKYNGEIFFIVKTDLDNLGNGNIEELKQRSINDKIKRGKLSIGLPPNTYVIIPADVY